MMRLYAFVTVTVSAVLMLVGIAMVAATIQRGGGPGATGVVVGACFALLGAGRLYLGLAGKADR